MRIDEHTEDAMSQSDGTPEEGREGAQATTELVVAEAAGKPARRTITPAKLPAHSQAAVAQRLNDVPEKEVPGFFYEASHRPLHPKGWRTARHMKRKHLRNTLLQMARTDRTGTRTLLNMAFVIITGMVLVATVFVGVTGFMQATYNRFGGKVSRLEDFLPKDYDLMYHGDMTLRCALLNSLNVPAVKLIQHIGIDSVLNTMHSLDLMDYQGSPGYSTVLGTLQFHLLDHVSAFGSFGNGGVHVPYYAIEKVEFTSTGQTWGHAQSQGTRVFSPQIAYMVSDVLSDYQQRVPQFGACNPLTLDPDIPHWNYTCAYNNLIPVAVKTGTTDQFQDVLTVGYSSDFVLGVWVGNNNNTPMDGINGIQGAAPIWHDAMIQAMQGHQIKGFDNPGGLHKVQQNYADGVSTVDWVLDGQAAPGQATTNNNNNNNNNQQKSGNGYCPCYSFGAKGTAAAW